MVWNSLASSTPAQMDMVSSTFGPATAAAVVAAPAAAVVAAPPAAVVAAPLAAVVAAAGALVLVASPQAANIRLIMSSKLEKAHFLLGIIIYSFTPHYIAKGTKFNLEINRIKFNTKNIDNCWLGAAAGLADD